MGSHEQTEKNLEVEAELICKIKGFKLSNATYVEEMYICTATYVEETSHQHHGSFLLASIWDIYFLWVCGDVDVSYSSFI